MTLPSTLSPREAEILALAACGQSNRAIARRLGLSVETVKTHVVGALNRLGACNRTQAVVFALAWRLITLDEAVWQASLGQAPRLRFRYPLRLTG